MALLIVILMGQTLGLAACGDGGDSGGQDTVDGGRVSLLGSWAVGYAPDESPPFVTDLRAADGAAEVVFVPFDHLGIPWAAFDGPGVGPESPPGPWLEAIDRLIAASRAAGKPWVLGLSPTSRDVDTLAADAREERGQLVVNPSWRPTCFDPASEPDPARAGQRYGRYAAWLVARARPDFVVVGSRVNLYEANCGRGPYERVLGMVAEAARRVRALAEAEAVPPQEPMTVPPIVAGMDVEDLYGLPSRPGRCAGIGISACLAQRGAVVEAFREALLSGEGGAGALIDVIGVESYPAVYVVEGAGAEIPARYLSDALTALGPGTKAILGTGLPARTIQSRQGPCVPYFDGSEDAQLLWLDRALAAGRAGGMPFVMWRTASDLASTDALASCPCAGDSELCQHLGTLGSRADGRRLRLLEGLVDGVGAPRSAAARWLAELE